MQYIVKLTDRDTGRVYYRDGEPGKGGLVNTPERAQRFDTRAEAEAYVGRLVTHTGLLAYNREQVSIEEYQPEPETVDLTISRETAQYLRNLLGNVVHDEHMDELRKELYNAAGVEFQPSRFNCEKWGITWKGAYNASD